MGAGSIGHGRYPGQFAISIYTNAYRAHAGRVYHFVKRPPDEVEHLSGLPAPTSPVCAVFLGVPCPVLTPAPERASAAPSS